MLSAGKKVAKGSKRNRRRDDDDDAESDYEASTSKRGDKVRNTRAGTKNNGDNDEEDYDDSEDYYSSDDNGRERSGAGDSDNNNNNNVDDEEEGDLHSSDEWGQDLMGNEEDRRYLSTLTEMERESILYERAQIRQRRLEKRELRRRLKQQDSDRVSRAASSSSNKRLGKMQELLKAREKKKIKRSEQHQLEEGETYEDDYDGDNGDGGQTKASRWRREEEDETSREVALDDEMGFEDVNSIYLSRSKIEKYLFRSFFPEMIKGMIVRIFLGQSREGSSVYRMALVDDLVTYNRSYKFGSIVTEKAIRALYVKSHRTFRLDLFSNSPIQPQEFSRWRTEMKLAKLPIYSKGQDVAQLRQRIRDFEETPIDEREVNMMVAEKQRAAVKGSSSSQDSRSFTQERMQILTELELARSDNDKAAVESLNEALNDLDSQIQVQKKQSGEGDRLNALTIVNKRNRLQNIAEIREAELKLRAQKKALGGQQQLDPFARRRCKPDSYLDFSTLSGSQDDANSAGAGGLKVPDEKNDSNDAHADNADDNEKEDGKEDDLFKAHDFDLDIDI